MQTETSTEQAKSEWAEAIQVSLYFGIGFFFVSRVLGYWLIYELSMPLTVFFLMLGLYPLFLKGKPDRFRKDKRPLSFISHTVRSLLFSLAAFLFLLLTNLIFEGTLFEAR